MKVVFFFFYFSYSAELHYVDSLKFFCLYIIRLFGENLPVPSSVFQGFNITQTIVGLTLGDSYLAFKDY